VQLVLADANREDEKGVDLSTKFLGRKDNKQVRFLQSYFYAMSGDAIGAQETFDSIDPKFHPLPFLRGVKARIAILEGRPADAVDDAIASYQDNKKPENLFLVVQALELTGQNQRSFEVLSAHSREFPNDMRGKMLLAERQIGTDEAQAIASYQEMLAQMPNNFVVLNNLAYLLMENGELDSAAEYAERAYEIQSDNAATADTYAQVLIKQGKIEEAVEIYSNVMTDKVDSEEIVLNYIDALLRVGSKVIAKRRLEARTFTEPASIERVVKLKEEFDI